MGILPNIFSKKEDDAIKKLKQQISSVKKSKKTIEKKTEVKKSTNASSTKKQKATLPKKLLVTQTPMAQGESVYYGNTIRRLYYNDHWYFFLEDVIAVSGKLDLEETINKLKNSQQYKENAYKYVVPLKAVVDNQPKVVDCIDDQGFLWLLPQVRTDTRVFPGPFPEWLKQTTKLPLPTPPEEKKN